MIKTNNLMKVMWRGCNGHSFMLSGDREFGGVVLQSRSGLVASVSRTLTGRANARGTNVDGVVIDALQGSLTVIIKPNRFSGQSVDEVWDSWLRSWSTDWRKPGTLTILGKNGSWSVSAFAENNIGETDLSPYSPNVGAFMSTVNMLALDGLWSGTPRDFKNVEIFDVYNAGSVDLHPDIFWVGEGQSFTLPSGRMIVLPTVTTEHRLSLDPGTGFKVWDSDGNEATSVWAAFRGLDVRGPIPPGETKEFRCSPTAWLRATPLHENPWG